MLRLLAWSFLHAHVWTSVLASSDVQQGSLSIDNAEHLYKAVLKLPVELWPTVKTLLARSPAARESSLPPEVLARAHALQEQLLQGDAAPADGTELGTIDLDDPGVEQNSDEMARLSEMEEEDGSHSDANDSAERDTAGGQLPSTMLSATDRESLAAFLNAFEVLPAGDHLHDVDPADSVLSEVMAVLQGGWPSDEALPPQAAESQEGSDASSLQVSTSRRRRRGGGSKPARRRRRRSARRRGGGSKPARRRRRRSARRRSAPKTPAPAPTPWPAPKPSPWPAPAPKPWPWPAPAPAPTPKAGCVARTEWKPVKGSEGCSKRYAKRRNEMPGFEPHLGEPKPIEMARIHGSKMQGKTCPRKYLARVFKGATIQVCLGRVPGQMMYEQAFVSWYPSNKLCEIFWKCPIDEAVNPSTRKHQKGSNGVVTYSAGFQISENGRRMKYTKQPKCNTKCGHLRTWAIHPFSTHSHHKTLPRAECGECRAQMALCALDKDGFTYESGMTWGPNSTNDVDTADFGDIMKGPGFEQGKKNHVCCKMHRCSASVATKWRDANAGESPCEENPGDLEIINPVGTDPFVYGRSSRPGGAMMRVKGSVPNALGDGNKCFQLKKLFQPHKDFLDHFHNGSSQVPLCYPRHEEVPVNGSEMCKKLASEGQCRSEQSKCKWIPPETQGECKPKVVPGSEWCESASNTCPGQKVCDPPAASTGCDYPQYTRSQPHLRKTYITGYVEEGEYNTTWRSLLDHGFPGKNGKCITQSFSATGSFGYPSKGIVGTVCKARPIDHPKLAFNGEPCIKASTKDECGTHSEICEWKPGPKCDLRMFHEVKVRCAVCKQYVDGPPTRRLPHWHRQTVCGECAVYQYYYSRSKGELACHILKHFFGMGPELTSRIQLAPHDFNDQGFSPRMGTEFLFDGKRTCILAQGARGRSKNPPKDALYVGGLWYVHESDDLKPRILLKEHLEANSAKIRFNSKLTFTEHYVSENSPQLRMYTSDFYETLEAVSEAIKNGGQHPLCPKKARPVAETVAVSEKSVSKPWPPFMKPPKKPCEIPIAGRTDVVDEFKKWGWKGKASCKLLWGDAKSSKEVCEGFYEKRGDWKMPCVFVPDLQDSPYTSACQACPDALESQKKNDECGPKDDKVPSSCPSECVTPTFFASKRSFTPFMPCTKFLNHWGFCGCLPNHKGWKTKDYKTLDKGNSKKPIVIKGRVIPGVDCRGCSKSVLSKMIGEKPCHEINPNIPPELCMALKTSGVPESKVASLSKRSHWAAGAQYYYKEVATCVAAGDPHAHCEEFTMGKCDPTEKTLAQTKLGCGLGKFKGAGTLWCAGKERVIAPGIVIEESSAGSSGGGYGSWAAQARELKRALANGGEHPSCPAATLKKEKEPCTDVLIGDFPNYTRHRLCDNDCKKLPYSSSKTPESEKASGLACGLRFAYPALRPPDAVPGGVADAQWYGQPDESMALFPPVKGVEANSYWKCLDAGYKLPKVMHGWDKEDAKFMAFNPTLFHTDLFGEAICTQGQRQFCKYDGKTDLPDRRLPGCRSDAWQGKLKMYCEKDQNASLPNALAVNERGHIKLSPKVLPSWGVNTCNKAETQQKAFECFGPLMNLKPGQQSTYGFRCAKNETLKPVTYGKGAATAYDYEVKCNKEPCVRWSGQWDFKSTASMYGLGLGRFSPGSASVAACVRRPLRCNGFCNCGDCSDEKDCSGKSSERRRRRRRK